MLLLFGLKVKDSFDTPDVPASANVADVQVVPDLPTAAKLPFTAYHGIVEIENGVVNVTSVVNENWML